MTEVTPTTNSNSLYFMYVAPKLTEQDYTKVTVCCRATVVEINKLQAALNTFAQRFKFEDMPMPLSGTTMLELLIPHAIKHLYKTKIIEHLTGPNKKVWGIDKKDKDMTNPLTVPEFIMISAVHDEEHLTWIVGTLELFKRQFLTPGSKPMAIVKPNNAALTDTIIVVDP